MDEHDNSDTVQISVVQNKLTDGSLEHHVVIKVGANTITLHNLYKGDAEILAHRLADVITFYSQDRATIV